MTDRKFYRSVFTFEVLSEGRVPAQMDLVDIIRETEDGDYNGNILSASFNEEIDRQTAVRLLVESGSYPEFFRLADDGGDLEDETADAPCCGDCGLYHGSATCEEAVACRDAADPWRKDPCYSVEDWQREVSEDNTRLGYLNWVEHQKEIDREESMMTATENPDHMKEAAARCTFTNPDEWEEDEGPETGVGVERWFWNPLHACKAYVCDDQGHLTVSIDA